VTDTLVALLGVFDEVNKTVAEKLVAEKLVRAARAVHWAKYTRRRFASLMRRLATRTR
jgi:hypothetical protein